MLEPISGFLISLAAATVLIAESITTITTSMATILAAIIAGLASISGFSAAAASVMPPPNENSGFYKTVHKYVTYFAFNIGHAKNLVTEALNKDGYVNQLKTAEDDDLIIARALKNSGSDE
jgi:ABC-type transport system substrate-binding protein